MTEYATRNDLGKLETSLSKKIDIVVSKAVEDLSLVIKDFAARVDERFNELEARVDHLEVQFERLNNTLDAFLKRLDDIEKDNVARDAQYARMERWIQQIAKQTGVKLSFDK